MGPKSLDGIRMTCAVRAIAFGAVLAAVIDAIAPCGLGELPVTASVDEGVQRAAEIERLLDLGLFRRAEEELNGWSAVLDLSERRDERSAVPDDSPRARWACLRARLDLDSLMYMEALESAKQAVKSVADLDRRGRAKTQERDQLWLQSRLLLARANLRNGLPREAAKTWSEITAWINAHRVGAELKDLSREMRRAYLENTVLTIDLSRDDRLRPGVRVPRTELNELRTVLREAKAAALFDLSQGNPSQVRHARDEIPWLARDFEALGTCYAGLDEWALAASHLEQTMTLWEKLGAQREWQIHAIRAAFRAADFWRRAAENEDDVHNSAKYSRRMALVFRHAGRLMEVALEVPAEAENFRIDEWRLYPSRDLVEGDRPQLTALAAAYEACLGILEVMARYEASVIRDRAVEEAAIFANERSAWRQEALWSLHNLLYDMSAYDRLDPPPPWSIVRLHEVRDLVSEALHGCAGEILRDADRRVMKLRLVVAAARLRGMVRANPLGESWGTEEGREFIDRSILSPALSAHSYFEEIAPPDDEQRLRAIDVLTTAEILLGREDPLKTQEKLEAAIADFQGLGCDDVELRDSLRFNLCWVLWRQRNLREALRGVDSLLADMEARSYVDQLRADALVLRSRIHAAVANFDVASDAMKEAEVYAKQLALKETFRESTLPYVLATSEMLLGALRPYLAVAGHGGADDRKAHRERAAELSRDLEEHWSAATIAVDELEKRGKIDDVVTFGRGTILHQRAILQFLSSQVAASESEAATPRGLAREYWKKCIDISKGPVTATPARRLFIERSRLFLAVLDLQDWEQAVADFWRQVEGARDLKGTQSAHSRQEMAARVAAMENDFTKKRTTYDCELETYRQKRAKLGWFSSPWKYASVKRDYELVKQDSDRLGVLMEELHRVQNLAEKQVEEQERILAELDAALRECLWGARSIRQVSAISSAGKLFPDEHEVSLKAKSLETGLARIDAGLSEIVEADFSLNLRLGFMLKCTRARVARAQGREDARGLLEEALRTIEVASAEVSEDTDNLAEFYSGFRFAYELLVDWCVEDAERADRLSREMSDRVSPVKSARAWLQEANESRKQALIYAQMARNRTFDQQDGLEADSASDSAFQQRSIEMSSMVNAYLNQCPPTLYYHVGAATSYVFLIPSAFPGAAPDLPSEGLRIVRLPSLRSKDSASTDVSEFFPGGTGLTEGDVWKIVSDYGESFVDDVWTGRLQLLKRYGDCLLPNDAREWVEEQSRSRRPGEGLVICPDADLYRLTFEALILEVSGITGSDDEATASQVRIGSPQFFADLIDCPTVYSLGLDPSLAMPSFATLGQVEPRMLIASHWKRVPIDLSSSSSGQEPAARSKLSPDDLSLAASYEAEWSDIAAQTGATMQVVAESQDVSGTYHVNTEAWLTDQLQAGQFTHIHLISHGKGPGQDWTKAHDHLVFAATGNQTSAEPKGVSVPNPRDGILRLGEIRALDLRGCELAVLSACGTNMGAVGRLEMPHGLSRAFLLAGARHVVASQWNVWSNETARLMKDFYASWVPHGAAANTWDYAEALHLARRKLRSETSSRPRDWAAFVLLYSPNQGNER